MDRSPTRPHSNAQTPAASARASRASLSWTADFETPRAKSLITPLRVFDRLRESAEVSPAFSPESPATFASPKRKLCSILGDHSMTSTQSSGIRHVPQSWKRKRVRTMDDECVFVGKERAVDTETLQSGTMMSSLPLSDPPVPTRYSDDEESPMLFRNERVVKGKVSISPVLFDLMKEDRKADLKASPSMKRDRSGLGTLPAMSDAGLSAQGQINKTNDRRISIHELRTRRSKAKKRRRVTISGTGMIKNGQIKTSGAKTPVLASRTRNAIGMERSLSTDNASSVMPIPNINGVKTPRLVHLRRTNRKLIRLDDADDNDVPNGSIKSPSKLLSMELPTPNAFPERGEPESAKKSIDNSSCNLSKSNGPPAVVDDPSPSNHTSLQKRTSQSKNPQCFVGSLQTDNDDEYGGDMEYGQSLLDIIHESTQRFGNGSSYHHNEDAEKMIALEEACGSHGCTPALSDGVGEIREHDSDTRLSLDEKKMELRDGGTKTVRIADSVKPKILGNSNVLRDNQMQEFETPSASISFSTGGGKPMTVNQASSDRGRKLIAEVSLTDGLVDEPGESYLDQNIGVLTASAKEEIGIPNIGRVDHLIFPSEGLNTLQNADLVSRAEFANQASSFSTERRQKMDLNPDTLGLVSRFSSEVAADPPTIASGTGEHPSTEIIDSNASFCFQTPKRISNVVDSKTVTISPESHGFTNGRGRKVEPNAAGLGVAAKLMAEISQDCALDSGIEIGDSSNRPQFGFGSTSRAPATVGFSTGSGKSVKVPPGGEERARRLIAEIEGMGEPLNSVASPTPAYATRNTNRLPFKEPPASPFPGLSTFNTQTKVSNLHVSSPPPGWTTGTIGKRQVFRSPLIISKERQVFRSPLIISKERILDQKMKGSGQVYTAAYSDVSQKRLALQRGDIDDENQPPEQWENQFNMSDTERGLSDLPSHGAGGFLRLTNGRGKAMPIPSKKGADFAAALISDSHPRGSELSVDDKGDLGKENRMFEGMNGPLNDFCKSTLSAVPKPFLGRTTGKGGSVRVPSARKLEQASAVFGDIFNALLASPSTRTAVHLGTAERPPKTPLLPGRASSFQNMKRTNSTTSTFSSGGSPSVNAGQTPKLPKRNGRFVLPQRTSSPFQQIAAPSSSTKPKNLEIFNLDERLHGRKQLSQLSDRQALTAEQLESIGITECIIAMTSASADSYRFPIDINNGWGVPEAHSALLEAGVIPTVATEKWVQNHYRWIVWKCAGMIRSFPEEFRRFWSPQYVLNQIKYRYEREVNRVHRSAIKMIVERDDLPSKFLVLCVSEIHPQSNGSVELDLTDGWYKIRASIDKALQRAVDKEKIFVGMKLRIAQAQLHSPRDATDVLDVTTETKLILSANGTRRATWDAKLGYQPRSTFTVRIGGISSDGGVVPCIDVVVLRKYVMQVMERLPNKSYIFRSAREDDIVSKKWNSDRDRILQSLETEFYQKSPMQHEVDSDIARDAIDQLKAELAEKLEELHPPRDTRTLINVRVCDYPLTTDSTLVKHAIFTIWAPNDNVLSMINEGQRLKIHRVAPRSVDRIQSKALMTLQTIRGTRFQSLKSEEEIVRDVFQPRSFASCTDLNHSKRGDEVDLVAHILSVGWRNCFQRNQGLFHEQLICATDHTGLLIVVRVGSYVPNPIWRAGVTVALLNMEYSYYSETGGAHVLRATMNYDVFRPGDTGIAGEIASTISAWASSQANLDELINDATVALDSVGPTLGPIGECPDCAKSIIAPFPLKPTTNDDVEGANLQTKSGQTISDLGYILRAHNNGENVDVKSGEILLGWDNGIEMMHLRCPADLFRSALIRIAKRYPKIVDNVVLLGEGKGEVQSSAVAICIENSFRMTQLTEETELDSCLDALSFVLLQCQYCPANRRISSLELPSKCIMEGLI